MPPNPLTLPHPGLHNPSGSARSQVFYLFGGIGLVWSLWWERLMEGVLDTEPEIAEALDGYAGGQQQQVPWRAFLRNRPVLALGFTHFCNNWCAGPPAGWGALLGGKGPLVQPPAGHLQSSPRPHGLHGMHGDWLWGQRPHSGPA